MKNFYRKIDTVVKIIDTVLFCYEYDVLELRLGIMADHVDKVVIVESDHTFSGIPKEYNLEKQWDRYAQWHHKIEYIKVKNMYPDRNIRYNDRWLNEDWSRDQMAIGWRDVKPGDVVIIGDCDEIVRPSVLQFIRDTNYDWYGLYMPTSYYKFNYIDTTSFVDRQQHYKVWSRAYRSVSHRPSEMRYMAPPGYMRDRPAPPLPIQWKYIGIHHAGWHFSWMGDEKYGTYKLISGSETEYNLPEHTDNMDINSAIKNGRDVIKRDLVWSGVDLDEYYPSYILNNRSKYEKYILPDTNKKVRDFWPKEIMELEYYGK